jgi:hypothetical protein
MTRMIFLAILTEALVELFFKAAPLERLRIWLIRRTPFFDTRSQGHLLMCKYCVSVWMGAAVWCSYIYLNFLPFQLAACSVVLSRFSNYIHLLFSTSRDYQINKRLERK